MSNPLRTPDDYELFVYMLTEQFPSVRQSTMTFVRLGATLARVSGELRFDHDIRLVIRERMLSHLARRADVEVTPCATLLPRTFNSGVSLEKKSRRAHGTQQPQHHQHLHHPQRVGSRARRRPDRGIMV